MRQIITTLAELVGAALVTVGAAIAHPAAGFIVAGCALVAVGVQQAPRGEA